MRYHSVFLSRYTSWIYLQQIHLKCNSWYHHPWCQPFPWSQARFMGPIWGPSGADRTQVGPMFATWILLSVLFFAKIWEISKSYYDVIDDVFITEILKCGIICYIDQDYAAKTELECVRNMFSKPQIIAIFISPLKLIEFWQFQNLNYYLTWSCYRWCHECVAPTTCTTLQHTCTGVDDKMTELNYSTRDGSNETGIG